MKFAVGFSVVAMSIFASGQGFAQVNEWTGGGPNNLWTTPSNWSLGLVPVNATTDPQSGWDDPTSPFYPLTPSASDDYPLGNNDAELTHNGTTTLIDSSVNATAYDLRVGFYGVSNTLQITGGHVNVGGILLPDTTQQTGFFLDIGRGFNQTSNQNPLAKVQMSGGTLNANFVLIPEQFIDPAKSDPYAAAPLNGEFDVSGGTVNTYFMNLGQLVGNGKAKFSGNAVINFVKRPDTGFGVTGYWGFNRGWFDSANQPIDSHGTVSLDISDNAVMNIFGTSAKTGTAPDGTELARYQGYADAGLLTANGGTAKPDIILETINGVTQITIRAPHPMVAGDYNNNGIVDAADYTVWRDHSGATFSLPNENPAAATPGVVDQEDYTFWKAHFGNTSGAGASSISQVPEPSAFVLSLCAVAALCVLGPRALRCAARL